MERESLAVKVIYPGTFDPVTRGHEDIIKRIVKLFPKLIVAVADNPNKKTLFSVDERVSMLQKVLGNMPQVEVIAYANLTVDFAQQHNVGAIIRGLRAVSDFDFEFQLAGSNNILCPELETIFFPTSAAEACVSSSLVREIAQLGGCIDAFVSPHVVEQMQQKLAADK